MLARFWTLDWSGRLLLGEALLAISVSSAAIRLMPFRRLVGFMGREEVVPAPQDHARDVLARTSWAIEAVARAVPWRTVCFQKGLAFHWMMRRRGVETVLHYGIAVQPGRGLAAHVWISLGDALVMGGEVANEFSRVASFPALPEAEAAKPARGR